MCKGTMFAPPQRGGNSTLRPLQSPKLRQSNTATVKCINPTICKAVFPIAREGELSTCFQKQSAQSLHYNTLCSWVAGVDCFQKNTFREASLVVSWRVKPWQHECSLSLREINSCTTRCDSIHVDHVGTRLGGKYSECVYMRPDFLSKFTS